MFPAGGFLASIKVLNNAAFPGILGHVGSRRLPVRPSVGNSGCNSRRGTPLLCASAQQPGAAIEEPGETG